jgi:DNA-binding MarR family transcriptional regulator
MDSDHAPIGWWLRRADAAIEAAQADALAAAGVTRTHWQALNLLHADRTTPAADVAATLVDFADGPAVDALLADLAGRGWVTGDQEPAAGLRLTEAGAGARADLLARVAAVRDRATAGISDDEYRATVATLRRLVANLAAV